MIILKRASILTWLLSAIVILFFTGEGLAQTESEGAPEQAPDQAPEKKSDGAPVKKKKKGKKKKARQHRPPAPPRLDMAVSLNLGYEATFGHSANFHYMPIEYIDLIAGAGYNSTGPKLGAGGALIIPLDSFGLRIGAAFVYSLGVSNQKVQIECKFTPEGSDKEETITAEKYYNLSSGMIVSTFGGFYYKLWENLNLVGQLNYNIVISGNNVTFKQGIKYNKNIEATNEDEFKEEFDAKAQDQVKAGGIGGSGGFQILF